MRRASIILAAVAILLASLPLTWGDEKEKAPPAAAADKPDVERLIEQLEDKDFQVRKAAEEAIEALGPDALPALRKALAGKPSLEVTRRIEKWIPQFELAALTAPKRVTLDVTGKPLPEVVAQIAKQTGYPLNLPADAEREKKLFDFKLNRVTFWEALEAVCAAGELVPSRDGEGKGFQLQYSDKHQPFVSRHGAFRLVAQSFHYSYSRQRSNQLNMVPRKPAEGDKDHRQQSESEALQFSFMVEVEPRVPVVGVGEAVVGEATDDQKQSLVRAADNRVMFGRVGRSLGVFGGGRFGGLYLYGTVQLKPPAKDAKTVALLKGTIPVHIQKDKKTVVLAEKVLEAKGKKIKLGESTVEIDEFKEAGNQRYDLYMTITGGKGEDGELGGELELLDEKGNHYEIGGSGLSSDGQTAKVHLSFGPPFNGGKVGPAVKLAYTTRITAEYALPFEFRNVPLP